jgi:hypothetical protein
MKKIIILLTCVLSIASAQTFTADFETFTLQPGSFYKDTNNTPFTASNVSFGHQWTNGAFPYWSGGFSYTNKYDSSTAGYGNIYGVIPFKGYNGSSIYCVAQDKAVIKLLTPGGTLDGFRITNTTYAYKSMKNGDSFAKKFGGSSGNDPDYFKLVIKGFRNGILIPDSVEFYLADFRSSNNSQDYIVNTWEFVNTSSLGKVDSIRFLMRSSDVGQFGINTPLFFGMDQVSLTYSNLTGMDETKKYDLRIYPNPFEGKITIEGMESASATILLRNLDGKIIYNQLLVAQADLSELKAGIYIMEIKDGSKYSVHKVVKK